MGYKIIVERIEERQVPDRYNEGQMRTEYDHIRIYSQRLDSLPIPKLKNIIQAVNNEPRELASLKKEVIK